MSLGTNVKFFLFKLDNKKKMFVNFPVFDFFLF